jgi:ribosomal protein S18 acetylase RimI-like enzyme
MFRMNLTLIRRIDILAANAWPAAEVKDLDGWLLRATDGVSRRANSVWPNANAGRQTLDEKLHAVEAFYGARKLPAYYHICPAALPVELDDVLIKRGYIEEAPTLVQIAHVEHVQERTRDRRSDAVRLRNQFHKVWFKTYYPTEGDRRKAAAARLGILDRIVARTAFAELQLDGSPSALGMGVLEQGWVGIFATATRPESRRRGAATAVLGALADWGQAQGATQMYLQVMVENSAARSLYAKIGFETLYSYHYRTVPTAR